MNIVIVGASAGLGRALAQEAASLGHDLLLCATGSRDLAVVAADLSLRFGIRADCVCGDVSQPEDRLRIVQTIQQWRPLDAILLPIGFSTADDTGSLDDASALRIVSVNFVAQACMLGALWSNLAQRKEAFVIGFGSVAAIRGRARNILYAASKRALESYFESLRVMAIGSRIHVQFYRMGYMKTQQTFGKRLLLPLADPEQVAKMVFRRFRKREGKISWPRWWAFIAFVLERLPWFLYKRLDF